jgi:hypothetical protein
MSFVEYDEIVPNSAARSRVCEYEKPERTQFINGPVAEMV